MKKYKLGIEFKLIRKFHEKSVRETSKLLNISRQHLYMIESNNSHVTDFMLEKFCVVFNIKDQEDVLQRKHTVFTRKGLELIDKIIKRSENKVKLKDILDYININENEYNLIKNNFICSKFFTNKQIKELSHLLSRLS